MQRWQKAVTSVAAHSSEHVNADNGWVMHRTDDDNAIYHPPSANCVILAPQSCQLRSAHQQEAYQNVASKSGRWQELADLRARWHRARKVLLEQREALIMQSAGVRHNRVICTRQH